MAEKMRKLNVTVQCLAVYNSSINVPKELSFEDAIKYAREHLDEVPLGTLEYVSGSDELDEENCDIEDESYTAFVYEEDGTTAKDLATYDNKDEAIIFAMSYDWDEVVNDDSGEVVWTRMKG